MPIRHVVTLGMWFSQSQPWRGAGVAVPVFSVRSAESVGAGEFLDLKLMVDMAAKTGMRLVQLLPVNDTSVNMMWWDSYPYRYCRISLTESTDYCIALVSQPIHSLETVYLLLYSGTLLVSIY